MGMLSVTQRVDNVSQPRDGYVTKSLFQIETYEDYREINDLDITLTSIQGMAVDYLTRFMITGDKKSAYTIPILGAKKIDLVYENDKEYRKAMALLDDISGLDRTSVVNTCKIVCYDVAFRKGIKFYQPAEDVAFNDNLFKNVPILVERSLYFLKSVGPIVMDGFTFEGGYTRLVDSGDGDYLTKDTLIDLKTSKQEMTSKWSLQLLMYYILGIHSVHKEFSTIKKLCIFNSLKNQSYTCKIADISDKSKYLVSQDVLGYKMKYSIWRWDKEGEDYSTWDKVIGSDDEIVRLFITKNSRDTGFRVDKYGDGIFDITLDDYWTYLRSTFEEYKSSLRPIFKYTKSVKLLKRNGYYMFVSISLKGKCSLLHGARLHLLKYPVEYYYDNIERYAITIIMRFSKYWDALRVVSEQIKSLEPTEKYLRIQYADYLKFQKFMQIPKEEWLSYDEWYKEYGYMEKLSGKIHGCIVDLDWSNHIYVNPYDGTVTSYNAASMYDKNVYKNVRSLLSAQRPEMLPSFDKLIRDNKSKENTSLLLQEKGVDNPLLVTQDDEISREIVKVYSWDMYDISNRLKPLQNIYDIKLVQIWYDEVLGDEKKQITSKYGVVKKDYIGQSKIQKNGLVATIIKCLNYKDVDVQFEDGVVVEHVSIPKWRGGTIQHPNIIVEKPVKAEKKKADNKKRIRERYIGMTKMMNCGMQATVIDYIDCKNVTIQFEDGLVKSGVRSDHFMNGKVSHS